MQIVLQNNIIVITTGFDTLNKSWMKDFLVQHSRGMLFLSKSVLVFMNDKLFDSRQKFIYQLGEHHSSQHDYSNDFILRSMLRYASQPIKIELNRDEEPEKVEVNLYAYDQDTVLISLKRPNLWVMQYFRSQLEVYIERGTDMSMVLNVSDHKSKARLDRTLNKKSVLHYEIKYNYNNHFLSTLYSPYANFTFGNLSNEREEDERVKFYSMLECPIGASQEVIKQSYKKLTKVYHPDKIMHESPYMVKHYTQKFQLLREAYQALKKPAY
jgi:hypothetical protein